MRVYIIFLLLVAHISFAQNKNAYTFSNRSSYQTKSQHILDKVAHPITPIAYAFGYLYSCINPRGLYFPPLNRCETWSTRQFVDHAYKEHLLVRVEEDRIEHESNMYYFDECGRAYTDCYKDPSRIIYKISDESQRKILQEHHLYRCDSYWQYVKHFPEYEPYILGLHKELSETDFFERAGNWCKGKYYTGLKDIVAEKAASIYKERNHKARCATLTERQEQKHSAQYDESQRKMMHQRNLDSLLRAKVKEGCSEYRHVSIPFCLPQKYQEARGSAIQQLQEKVVWEHKTYTVTYEAEELIHKYSIDTKIVQELDGHQLQHVIHQEFIDIISATAQQPKLIKTDCEETIMQFADAGLVANIKAECLVSMRVANFCWGLLYAVGEGVALGAQRAVSPFLHPIRTAGEIGEAVKMLGHLFCILGNDLNLYIKCSPTLQFVGGLECMLDDLPEAGVLDHNVLKEALKKRNGDNAENETVWMAHCERRKQQISILFGVIQEQLSHMELKDVVREGVACVVDAKVPAKLFTAMSGVLKHADKYLVAQIKKIKREKVPLPVAATAEGLQFSIVEQAYQYMEDAQKIGKEAIEVAKSSIETVAGASAKFIKPFFHAVLSETELLMLRQKFDQLMKFKNTVLQFCYEHVFNGEIYKNGALGGLHHDFSGKLQKADILKLRKTRTFVNGYYEAEIWCAKRERWVQKSFFPDHYTREDVMQRIVEALRNPQVTRAEGSREIIKGLASDGMIIRIVTEVAEAITAYPDFKEFL